MSTTEPTDSRYNTYRHTGTTKWTEQMEDKSTHIIYILKCIECLQVYLHCTDTIQTTCANEG